MATSDIYQISSTDGTTSAMFSASPPPTFLAMLPTQPTSPTPMVLDHVTPGYSPVIGPGGSTGSGWPFGDYNMMNDPEGNLAVLPAIVLDGAGGPAGDPFAFVPSFDDNAAAGYANVGAGMTGSQGISLVVNDPGYQAAAVELNASDLAAADADGIQLLAQDAASIAWNSLSEGPPYPDIMHGFAELLTSAGVLVSAAAATAGSCAYSALKNILTSPSNPEVKGGMTAFAAVQCGIASAVALGKAMQSLGNGPMDADENAAASLMYRSVFMDLKSYSPSGGVGVDGGDGLKAISGGSAKSFDATLGGTMNYLTSTYDTASGTVHVLHS